MKTQTTRRLVESALMIAVGTVLSVLKVDSLWAFGGGLTIGSMVPLVLISHRWGIKWGTFTAFVYSLLQLILGVDNIQYATSVGMAIAIILLDYVIAYTVIGLAAMFGSSRPGIIGGVVVTLGIRFLCHFLSGWMIWDALFPNELGMTSAVYSLWYNGSYMLPEILITAVLACILVPWVQKTFPRR
ncbi:MAG: energy-coupled thiamine transporter ThiT [Angelakisella sp.]|nr:energy-coupled thiamine transporter ThiT [Angelakisella sp.]